MKLIVFLLPVLWCLGCQRVPVQELKPVADLRGSWKFNIGDDTLWAKSDFNDDDWDELLVPRKWEDQGYIGYDGYAWYRRSILIPALKEENQLYLQLGHIDDVNEAFFKGQRIGQAGLFPPHFETAYNVNVLYVIPSEYINFGGVNTLAVRVYDDGLDGGIVSGNVQVGYNPDVELLSQNLAGSWKIAFDDHKSYVATDFNDDDWRDIMVPATWESQGFGDYDGQACYRITFRLAKGLAGEILYLSLGKIDDRDEVYLNGNLIGTTDDMYGTALGSRLRGDWQIRRLYKIPPSLLNPTGNNTIAVIVSDSGGEGGIFEGPVGLMSQQQAQNYSKKYGRYFKFSVNDFH